ncbi:hypothetical protein JYU34_015467 [Plutella xylostella]|uniref:G-protein coupled receptors family 1 profile domain-containing protein n=1 Tax=Plutella xylostella TaxID=51655 RepID=A0ABQ7Q773_PLUXY|nr:hypothetical protein JYU34_015467 [Plutella xylostella]
MKSDKIVELKINRTDTIEYERLVANGTETYDFLNFTEEPCVGEPEYCNMTREEYLEMLDDYIFPQPYEWVLIGTHAVVFFIGLVGNALVCIAVYRNHAMRTVTNYFIVNLAVADFMVILICLPPTVLWDVTETWFFGTAMCRIVLYFQSVAVTVSVLTLTFISVDRWYAICFPLKFKSTTGRAKTAILIIWLLSLLFNVPEFVVLQVQRKMALRFDVQYFMQCTSTWSHDSDLKWHIIKGLFLYTFPLLLMTIAYCQIVRVLWRSDNIPGHTESHKLCTGTNNCEYFFFLFFIVFFFFICIIDIIILVIIVITINCDFFFFIIIIIIIIINIAYCQIVRVLWRSDNIPGHTESHKLCTGTNNCEYNFSSFIWFFFFFIINISTESHKLCTSTDNWLAASRRTVPSIHANASTEGQLRSRRKAAKMLVAVVAMFAVCYFPVHLLSVLRFAYDVRQSEVMTAISLISHVMCYANSAVNPLIYNFMSGKFRREFHRSYFRCLCCCYSADAPDRNGTCFAPIGSSRAGTTRTIVRRNDSCASYRLTHLSPSNHNSINRDYFRNTNTSFIDPMNGPQRQKIRDDAISEPTARFSLTTDVGKD